MRALLLLTPLVCAVAEAHFSPAVKEFYMAAVEIGWDYIHLDPADSVSDQWRRSKDVPQKYIKAVYREYTDSTYTVLKPRPAWAGIQGPVIYAQAGDRVVVHFKNLASQAYSISPVGVTYWKQSEGAGYDDSTAGQEKEDDAVQPGGYYEYVWDISPKDSPTANDPECLTYSYSSHVDTVRDTNSGLIGVLLICKSSAFRGDGQKRSQHFVLLFAVFDETHSWYGEIGERKSREKFRKSSKRKYYHTINGYIDSTLPGLTLCEGRDYVIWHLIGMGTAPEIHSIHFQEHSLRVMAHRKVNLKMTPMTFITAEMKPTKPGQFLISCQIHAHQQDGMSAVFTVEHCPEQPRLPGRDLYNVKNDNFDDEKDYINQVEEDNTRILQPERSQLGVRSFMGRQSKTRVHYIAAEEIIWDYAPHLSPTDSKLQSAYIPSSPHQLGHTYKKVVYVEYKDGTFTQRKNTTVTLMGPVLKGEVHDQLNIIFKNMASRPYNIYPNGLTSVRPQQPSANAAEKDLQSMEVPPNGTFGYIWRLTTDDGPLEGDPQCLTHLYQSSVHPERDLASGLVGTLLVCKYETIDLRGRLVGPDKEKSLMFAVIDENISWYIKENIQMYSRDPSQIDPTDPDFYDTNVIYSVNGFMFNERQFIICQSDVTFWHVANVGTQSDFLSIYFTGNPFKYNNIYQSILTLFPMTSETVPMETELIGEWEISAFDGSLRSRGMTIRYSVLACDNGGLLVDSEDEENEYLDYLDQLLPMVPRGVRPQNCTKSIRLCKKPPTKQNATGSANATGSFANDVRGGSGAAEGEPDCEVKEVVVTSSSCSSVEDGNQLSNVQIPQDILEELDRNYREGTSTLLQDGAGPGRRRRQAEDSVARDMDFGDIDSKEAGIDAAAAGGSNGSTGEPVENSETLLDTGLESPEAQELDRTLKPQNHQEFEARQQTAELPDLEFYDFLDDNETASGIALSFEYDDYNQEQNSTLDTFSQNLVDPRSGDTMYRSYYIAAEEVFWDYGINLPHQLIRLRDMRRGMRKFLPKYKKVVFRAYRDESFLQPVTRGELEEHLGIMGPIIRAEINDLLTVTFKNKASRPYSFHLQGVYDRSQGASVIQTQASSAQAGIPGEAVPPGETRVYNWRVARKQGPISSEFDCKAGAYYSTVDKERDIHSGLIGPLIICKAGTLHNRLNLQPNTQEYCLLFHTFDETKSWYMEENLEQFCTPPCSVNPKDPTYQISNRFAAINGYVAETLPGLLVAQHQVVRWHLLNVGSDKEYHAVHFHGLPFSVQDEQEHRMGVYNLYPGVFGTVEMRPSTVGTWLVECTVGDYQLAGMRAKLLVYNPRCVLPLGMQSGRIEDSQITASDHIDKWEPQLARLELSGSINAWISRRQKSWIQVDLKEPTLLHGIQTQGAKIFLRDYFITHFTISYSLDMETWNLYKANSTRQAYLIFNGNMDGSKVKENWFVPPILARYIRIHPLKTVKKPALRLELLGCDLNSCSLPLGLERKFLIPDDRFDASSHLTTWFHDWSPSCARLHLEGPSNAWRPKYNNPHEWLQVDLGKMRRITGVVTQGASLVLTQMMVTEFSVTFSEDGHSWSTVLEEESQNEKIFTGNNDIDEETFNLFDPPLFGRYLRIHPRGWMNDIALRLEVLGCDTLQRL